MNSDSGPNMATVTTQTCLPARLPFLQYVDSGVEITLSLSLSLSEDDLTVQRARKLFQQTWKPETKRHETDTTTDYTLLA